VDKNRQGQPARESSASKKMKKFLPVHPDAHASHAHHNNK